MYDPFVGKSAYKKSGFFAGLIGTLRKCDAFTPYKIVFDGEGASGGVGVREGDFVIIEDKDACN